MMKRRTKHVVAPNWGKKCFSDKFVQRLLQRLSHEGGLNPGKEWGKGFYSDMFSYLNQVATETGKNLYDLAVAEAIRQLKRDSVEGT